MAHDHDFTRGWNAPPLDVVRFRKVVAMFSSPFEAEARTARSIADRMAEAAGMFLNDAIKACELADTERRPTIRAGGPERYHPTSAAA